MQDNDIQIMCVVVARVLLLSRAHSIFFSITDNMIRKKVRMPAAVWWYASVR